MARRIIMKKLAIALVFLIAVAAAFAGPFVQLDPMSSYVLEFEVEGIACTMHVDGNMFDTIIDYGMGEPMRMVYDGIGLYLISEGSSVYMGDMPSEGQENILASLAYESSGSMEHEGQLYDYDQYAQQESSTRVLSLSGRICYIGSLEDGTYAFMKVLRLEAESGHDFTIPQASGDLSSWLDSLGDLGGDDWSWDEEYEEEEPVLTEEELAIYNEYFLKCDQAMQEYWARIDELDQEYAEILSKVYGY